MTTMPPNMHVMYPRYLLSNDE